MRLSPRRFIRATLGLGSLLLLTGCGPSVLLPHGPIGFSDRLILFDSLAIMMAIVVPTIGAGLLFAFWFRASNPRAQYRPHFVYSGRLELVVWGIPTLVILFLAGLIWIGAHRLDPAEPIASDAGPLNIQVVALDWKWLFIYPDQGVAAINDLVVPAGVPLHFSITSATVMNVFFVPQLGSMIYAMNGMMTQLHLLASNTGDYYGESSQFSGDGFSGMHFTLHAVAPEAFSNWVTSARGAGPVLDRAAYDGLLKQSLNVKPYTFRAIDPRLFEAIVTQRVPPGEGPQVGRPAPDVHPVSSED